MTTKTFVQWLQYWIRKKTVSYTIKQLIFWNNIAKTEILL